MSGKDAEKAAIADQYFDDMMSVFSPKMMLSVIDMGVAYVNGNWSYEVGSGSYEPVFIVGRNTAAEIEGFTGHQALPGEFHHDLSNSSFRIQRPARVDRAGPLSVYWKAQTEKSSGRGAIPHRR